MVRNYMVGRFFMEIRKLQINHMTNPVGIAGDNIYLTWNLHGGKKQQAYRALIILQNTMEIYEDSGVVQSSDMHYRSQKKLMSASQYIIRLSVWDENNIESDTAEGKVVTGINNADWKAKWIDPEISRVKVKRNRIIEPRYDSYLVRDFQLDSKQLQQAQKGAFCYATCHGIMNIRINNREVTNHELLPGTQQYNKRLRVETIDVGEFLVEGDNHIEVSIGDGWYRGSLGNDQNQNVYGDDLALLLQIDIDGETVLITDDKWQATQNGPIRENDFMAGENYDARLENLSELHPVKIVDIGYDNLISNDTVPIIAHESFKPKYINVPNGARVLDFGQNLVGYVSIDLEAEEGNRIKMVHGEELDPNGNFTIANFQNQRIPVKQEINYICKSGRNKYHPTKTYMGFRYVLVDSDMDIPAECFTAHAIYSDMWVLSDFKCGVAEVNKLFENAIWSMKGNFIDIPTDCPTREKSGFSGDCQAFIHTAMYLMDCYSVYAKWMREHVAGQYADGCVPQISPVRATSGKKERIAGIFTMDGGIGWSDSMEIVPYRMWHRYGDDTVVRENYEAIKRWTEYEIKRAARTKLVNRRTLPRKYRKYMIDTGWMWGEWLEPGQDSVNYMKNIMIYGDPEIGTAFLYLNLVYMSDMAHLLGYTEDEARYRDIAAQVADAYRHVYLNDKGEVIEDKRQCRLVRPIAHGLINDEEKKVAADKLANMVVENGNHLNTGFLTTHELCRSLSRYGHAKTAYDLLLQREKPSWLYAVNKGCTTIPESWDCFNDDGDPVDSFNHYSYGAITGWLMDSAAGINVEDGKIRIAPCTDSRIGYVNASYDSPVGFIVSNWCYDKDRNIKYHIEIPANTTATVELEGYDVQILEPGVYDL